MRLFSKLIFVAIFAALSSAAVFAQSPNADSAVIEFPEIDGWTKGPINRFPSVELGYSAPYRSELGVVVTAYVYNGGNKTIPDNLGGIVKKEFEKVKGDIYAIEKQGVYKNVKEVKSDTVNLGGAGGKISVLHALFTFSIQGRDVNSEIFIFPYQNRFIKIRATCPISLGADGEKELAYFLKQIDTFFTKLAGKPAKSDV